MTILTFPTLSRTPSSASFRLRGNTQTHRSPLDGTTQTLEMPGATWEMIVSWNSLPEADWRTLSAFLSSLRGRAGRFTFSPAIFAPRRGVATGSPTVRTAPASGTTLQTEGWAPGSGTTLAAGDWLSFVDATGRTRLHIATQPAVADAITGHSTHIITPPLRAAPVIGNAVQVAQPVGVFMLAEDASPEIEIRAPRLGSVSITLVEALI